MPLRMKLLLACALASALLSSSPAGARAISLEYRASLLGVPIASTEVEVYSWDGVYRVRSRLATRGVVGTMAPWSQKAISTGRIDADGAVRPQRHWQNGFYKGEPRHMDLHYEGGLPVIASAEPDPDKRPDERRVPVELTAATLDPLSALFSIAQRIGDGRGCAARLPVFDGRQRYDVTFRDPDRSEGGTAVCDVTVEHIAGFKRKQGIATDPARPGRVWFALRQADMPPVPIRARLPTRWGTAVIELVASRPVAAEAAETDPP